VVPAVADASGHALQTAHPTARASVVHECQVTVQAKVVAARSVGQHPLLKHLAATGAKHRTAATASYRDNTVWNCQRPHQTYQDAQNPRYLQP
jgi:hypothetical protein